MWECKYVLFIFQRHPVTVSKFSFTGPKSRGKAGGINPAGQMKRG